MVIPGKEEELGRKLRRRKRETKEKHTKLSTWWYCCDMKGRDVHWAFHWGSSSSAGSIFSSLCPSSSYTQTRTQTCTQTCAALLLLKWATTGRRAAGVLRPRMTWCRAEALTRQPVGAPFQHVSVSQEGARFSSCTRSWADFQACRIRTFSTEIWESLHKIIGNNECPPRTERQSRSSARLKSIFA